VAGLGERCRWPRRGQQEGGKEREHSSNLTRPADELQLAKKNVSVW
jgi:hypothetical protein